MFILYAPILAFVVGLALGGRAERLGTVHVRWLPALLVAMLVQGPLFGPAAGLLPAFDWLGIALYVGSSGLALAAIAANRRLPGLASLATGAALNLIAIVANGGVMPTTVEAARFAGLEIDATSFTNSALFASPRVPWLTDVFALPAWLPFANVFSVGDVLIAVGAAWFVVATLTREPVADAPAGERAPSIGATIAAVMRRLPQQVNDRARRLRHATADRITIHSQRGPAEGRELRAYEEVMWYVRLAGLGVIVAFAPALRVVDPIVLVGSMAPLAVLALVQRRWLADHVPIADLRRRAAIAAAADAIAVYGASTAFAADPVWAGYIFYPVLALEAALLGGARAAVLSSAVSTAVYLGQLVLRSAAFGFSVDLRLVSLVIALYAIDGSFIGAAFGRLAGINRDLEILLDVAGALSRDHTERSTIALVDDRLARSLGAHVRSIALLTPGRGYRIVRARTPTARTLDRRTLAAALPNLAALEGALAEGRSVTIAVTRGDGVANALGLPRWVSTATLVPIHSQRRWIGVLPVLWRRPTTPAPAVLELLHALGNQVGASLTTAELGRARAEAATDPLTGLVNRRALREHLTRLIGDAPGDVGVAVLFCDLDRFKTVNDRHGHEVGDNVLVALARAILAATRQGDVVGRYGGDEVAIVTTGVDDEALTALAERVREAVRLAGRAYEIDVTIGVARSPLDGETPEALIAAADDAMYRGKHAGGGTVVFASRPGSRVLGLLDTA